MANHFKQILSESSAKLTEELLDTFNNCKKSSKILECAEINLLNSIKPFLNNSKSNQVNSLAEAMSSFMAINTILESNVNVKADPLQMVSGMEVRAQGVTKDKRTYVEDENSIYEIDESCMLNETSVHSQDNGMLWILLLLLLFR